METSAPRLSIVTSMFRSAPFLVEFHRRCATAAAALTSSYEFVFVNDGSPDESLEVALQLRAHDPRVRIVDLSRNFGHHKALMTGLAHASGELVFLTDCDLEEDPEWLLRFHEAMTRTRAEVVYGVQSNRRDGVFRRAGAAVFYRLFNRLLAEPIPMNVVTARLMSRQYVQALLQHRDREICIAGLWVITGFTQVPMEVVKTARKGSTYTIRRRASTLINAVTSFSNRPLIYIFYIGIAVMALSTLMGIGLVWFSLSNHIGVPGFASLMVSMWFLGGLTIFCLGIIGIYLAKVFIETKDRPYTIVRAVYGGHQPHDQTADSRAGSSLLRG